MNNKRKKPSHRLSDSPMPASSLKHSWSVQYNYWDEKIQAILCLDKELQSTEKT